LNKFTDSDWLINNANLFHSIGPKVLKLLLLKVLLLVKRCNRGNLTSYQHISIIVYVPNV